MCVTVAQFNNDASLQNCNTCTFVIAGHTDFTVVNRLSFISNLVPNKF